MSAGGRVLNAVGSGPDIAAARGRGLRARGHGSSCAAAGTARTSRRACDAEPDGPADDSLPLRVSTLELFFDLVFVFAITQLTGILSHEG